MDKTPEAIIDFAAAQAAKEWHTYSRPYLLARLSPELAAQEVDYREVLGEQKLKDFVRTAPEKIKVIVHPTQKSKIGLIPPDKDFAYAAEPLRTQTQVDSSPRAERAVGSRRRYIISSFLQLVSELEDAEAAQVQIPTHILTKLMRDR